MKNRAAEAAYPRFEARTTGTERMNGGRLSFAMRSRPLAARLLAAVLGLALCAMDGHGESPWSHPLLAGHLQAEAEDVDAFEVRMKWREAVRDSPDRFVTGFLVEETDTETLRDYYFDEEDRHLDEHERAALGIEEKDWTFPAVTRAPEYTRPTTASVKRAAPPHAADRASVPLLALSSLNEAVLRAEDATGLFNPAKGVRRIGVRRGFEAPVVVRGGEATEGAWRTRDDGGWLWALRIQSPGAIGVRLFFPVVDLPEGGAVFVYNAADPGEALGPYRAIPEGDQGLWTGTIFGDETLVELRLPADVDRGAAALEIESVAHQYVDPVADETLKRAGECHLDVSCYEAWQNEADAVAGIGTMGGSAMLWCSGALVSGGDSGEELFLTAYHCVNESNAPNTELYWFHQTDACGGRAPALSGAPRTEGGADFLVGQPDMTFGDVTLMRLRQTPPPGVRRLGWSSGPQAIGQEVATIHHPSGSFKRISFGGVEEMQAGSFRNPDAYYRVVWSEGSTEPGSSGAPLLTMDGGLLIGQLHGGEASCARPDAPDYYGQFRVSYPLLEPWLRFSRKEREIDEDVNRDGVVDARDLQLVINVVLGIPLPAGITEDDADVNNDGIVNALDIQQVINALLSGSNDNG